MIILDNIESFREYCLSKKGTEEDFPFGETTLVFRVLGKIFAITGLDSVELKVNLKCDPDWSIELREKYPEIIPGYHMNKKHWNTVDFEGYLSEALKKKLIDHSYELVAKGLSNKLKEQLLNL